MALEPVRPPPLTLWGDDPGREWDTIVTGREENRPKVAHSPHVLVVDDEREVRMVLAKILREEGFDVGLEADGSGALESARLVRPDLILLDVMMEGVDGLEVCRQLKADQETRLIPIVLLTGLSLREDRLRGLEAGADDFLSKPVDRSEMIARLRGLIRSKQFTDRLVKAESVVLSLARSIEGKDPFTEGHCERLSELAVLLGQRLDQDPVALEALSQAGYLHDIGKVAVPDSILLKPGPLDAEEWDVMKRHPIVGEHICGPVDSFREVLPIIRHHHEKGDGSGYPDGLAGGEIPETARILQTVDVFDALTSSRPYKDPMEVREAIGVMDQGVSVGWWDPPCVDAFTELVRESPRVVDRGR